MINLESDIFNNFRKDLEGTVDKAMQAFCRNDKTEIISINAKIIIEKAKEENEVTGDEEIVPKVSYENKVKLYAKPIESKSKGIESDDYAITVEDDEVVLVKRQKAQIAIEEVKEGRCRLGKDKHQDIQNCKHRKTDSCEDCPNYI